FYYTLIVFYVSSFIIQDYDELTPKTTTPYTGDNHSDFAAFALMGASLIIFLVLIISRKKNDDKEPEDHSALCPEFIEIDED
ncbi:LPXTG cell wall anchor domain-containing protein, partial [Ruminococcus sp.]|uniref:LPXTG cell wall anchor domain-containing protein n=1 Tax=Ruminococcus sp. TaxID=41978 RepID=UPI00257EFC22